MLEVLTEVWHLDLDLAIVYGLLYSHVLNFSLEVPDFVLIWIWSMVFCRPMFRILALYLDFEGAKNIHVLKVLILGFGGHWRFLTGVRILIFIWI